ncbi:MAG: hybrid sensor histidine kinase/response regulator [Polyangiales bacterium]
MARVLHIEDDPNNRRLVQKLLGAAGHEVIEAEGGVEGIQLARETLPDLVLVDINIPDLDGYEVTLRLRGISALQDVPIVAITAEADRDSTLAVGCDGFIAKPIDAAHFAETIGQFLGGHREWADDASERLLRERTQKIVERLEKKIVELSETNRRLEDVARLRREFMQNVSHELATPMTPVVGYLRLLLNEELGPLTDLQHKCLNSIEKSTQRLRAVVDTLLDVSSLETGRMHYYTRDYDFGEVAKNAIDQIRAKLEERDVTLTVHLPDDPLPAQGDPDKLLRAMVHVLDNASKFTPIGGEVAVEVRAEDDERLMFGVADSGPGVRPEHIARIMEPFYQVDGSVTRDHGGVGLGLAFARRVTEALGGGIEISSPPAGAVAERQLSGTLVELRVSRSPERPEAATK